MLLTAEEEAILLADLPTLPDEFALPLPPPPAESSETELDLLALQLEDERLRKVMEARLCSFEADRAELREMMTSAADSSGGGADAAELEEDAGRAARQRALDEALRHAQAELDAWEPDVNSLIDPTATEMGGAASGGPSSLGRSSLGGGFFVTARYDAPSSLDGDDHRGLHLGGGCAGLDASKAETASEAEVEAEAEADEEAADGRWGGRGGRGGTAAAAAATERRGLLDRLAASDEARRRMIADLMRGGSGGAAGGAAGGGGDSGGGDSSGDRSSSSAVPSSSGVDAISAAMPPPRAPALSAVLSAGRERAPSFVNAQSVVPSGPPRSPCKPAPSSSRHGVRSSGFGANGHFGANGESGESGRIGGGLMGSGSSSNLVPFGGVVLGASVPFGGRADATPNTAPIASVSSADGSSKGAVLGSARSADGSSRPPSAVPSAGSRPTSAARSAVVGGAHWLTSQGGPGSGVGGLIGSGVGGLIGSVISRPGSGCGSSRPLTPNTTPNTTPDFSLGFSRAALGTALDAGMRVAAGGGGNNGNSGNSGNGVLGGAGGGAGVVLGASVPAGGGLAACRGLAAAAGSHGAVVGVASGRHLPGPPPPQPLLSAASVGAVLGASTPVGTLSGSFVSTGFRPASSTRPTSSHQLLPTFSERDAGALSSKAAADVTSTRRIVSRDKLERKLVSR